MGIAPAVEHYWDVLPTESTFMTKVTDLYLVGDAVGRFRGMLQAAWSGLICAHAIMAADYESLYRKNELPNWSLSPKIPISLEKQAPDPLLQTGSGILT